MASEREFLSVLNAFLKTPPRLAVCHRSRRNFEFIEISYTVRRNRVRASSRRRRRRDFIARASRVPTYTPNKTKLFIVESSFPSYQSLVDDCDITKIDEARQVLSTLSILARVRFDLVRI